MATSPEDLRAEMIGAGEYPDRVVAEMRALIRRALAEHRRACRRAERKCDNW
jgi:hypothetical protein